MKNRSSCSVLHFSSVIITFCFLVPLSFGQIFNLFPHSPNEVFHDSIDFINEVKDNIFEQNDKKFRDKIDDPDIGRQTPDFIKSRGFKEETHYVTTKDGYILGVHRIVNHKIDDSQRHKRPVILQHGLLASSVDFVENSPGGCIDEKVVAGVVGNNLGFELAKRGYDVWMPNTRGNW